MDSDFKKWMTSQGFNGKEVAKAGEAIGIGRNSSHERHRGEKEMSLTERLAMSAVAAGLPAWQPSNQAEFDAYAKVIEAMRAALADLKPGYRPSVSTGNHIPAE